MPTWNVMGTAHQSVLRHDFCDRRTIDNMGLNSVTTAFSFLAHLQNDRKYHCPGLGTGHFGWHEKNAQPRNRSAALSVSNSASSQKLREFFILLLMLVLSIKSTILCEFGVDMACRASFFGAAQFFQSISEPRIF